jgi:hypothetical protein
MFDNRAKLTHPLCVQAAELNAKHDGKENDHWGLKSARSTFFVVQTTSANICLLAGNDIQHKE